MTTSYSVHDERGRSVAGRIDSKAVAVETARTLALNYPGTRHSVYRNGEPLKVAGTVVGFYVPAKEDA